MSGEGATKATREAMRAALDGDLSSGQLGGWRWIYQFTSDGRRVGPGGPGHMQVRDDGHLARSAGITGEEGGGGPAIQFDPFADLTPEERDAYQAGATMCAGDAAASLGLTVRQFRRRIETANRKLRNAAILAERR